MKSIARAARGEGGTIARSMGICGWLFLAPVLAHAQETQSLVKQTQNPVAGLVQVPIQGNWDSGMGDRESTGTLVNVQPVMPFSLTKNINVIARVVVPFASQSTPTGTTISGIGDTLVSLFLLPAHTGRFIYAAGPVMLVPTATARGLGAEKIGVGPTAVALTQPGRLTIGMLFNQVWSVSGANDRADVRQPVNLQAAAGPYLDARERGPEWRLRFGLTLLFPQR